MNLALLRRWLPLILLTLALSTTLVAARLAGVTISSALHWLYQTAHDAPWLLLLLFFLRPPFILPISWLVLLCGMLWGLVAGGAMAVAGMLLSAVSSYALARYAIPARADNAKSGNWARRLREQGLMSVVLMRLMLLPFDVVNFAAAGLRVDFRSYFVGTVLGNSVATLIYASVGAAIHVDVFLSEGKLPPLHEVLDARQLLLSLAVLAVSLLVARYFKRRNGAKA